LGNNSHYPWVIVRPEYFAVWAEPAAGAARKWRNQSMRINAVRSPILVFAVLTAVFVPVMTSQGAVRGSGASSSDSDSPGSTSSSPSAPDPSDSPVPAPAPVQASASVVAPVPARPRHHHHPRREPPTPVSTSPAPTIADMGAFYRSVLDLRPDMPGISNEQYYYIGQAFCTQDDLGLDELNEVQAAYAMPAGSLAYDESMATMMLETAPMEFIQENQDTFGFDGSDYDEPTLNAFRRKLCTDHPLWSQYAQFVHEQLETLGPWQTDPDFADDPDQSAELWGQDLATWQSALQPWLPSNGFDTSS
jgi:hypothetical protein